MPTIALAARRQVTVPREVCDDLGIKPGDRLVVERQVIGGQRVWVLRADGVDWSWVASVSGARKASHKTDDIRKSIARGRMGRSKGS